MIVLVAGVAYLVVDNYNEYELEMTINTSSAVNVEYDVYVNDTYVGSGSVVSGTQKTESAVLNWSALNNKEMVKIEIITDTTIFTKTISVP